MSMGKHVVFNPMLLSILIGMLCSVFGLHLPGPIAGYLGIHAGALTPCALFAIGLGCRSMDYVPISGRPL